MNKSSQFILNVPILTYLIELEFIAAFIAVDTFSTYFILLTSVQYLIRFCSDKMLMSERPLSRDSVRWICQRMRSPYIAKKYGDYLSDEVKTRVGSFYKNKVLQVATYYPPTNTNDLNIDYRLAKMQVKVYRLWD